MLPTEDATQWASQYFKKIFEKWQTSLPRRRWNIRCQDRYPHRRNYIQWMRKTELREITCNPEKCFSYQRGDCRRVAEFAIPVARLPRFGVYQLDTSSFYSMVNVNSSLELISSTCGRLSMLPLSLKLIEREYKPEAENQTFKILSFNYALLTIWDPKIRPGPARSILLLPAPDSEAPDDLFPKVKSRQNNVQANSQCDNELMHLWDKAKRLINQVDIQNFQVTHYFSKFYHIEVNLHDFEAAEPLAKFTVKNLAFHQRRQETYPILINRLLIINRPTE